VIGPLMADEDVRPILYLEDLVVGQQFTSGAHAMTEAEIIAFARQFDPQPFHTHPELAKDSLFAGLAASGWHTAAVTMRLLVHGGPRLAGGMIGGGGELAWPKPTRPGDVLHVVSTIEAVTPSRSRPERGMVLLRSETIDQRGEVAQTMLTKQVVQRRGA
jgi:acyl dehydratase